MDSHQDDQQLKQRSTKSQQNEPLLQEQYNKSDQDTKMDKNTKSIRKQKAKQGLRSLTIALSIPLLLTLLDIFLFGSSYQYVSMKKPFWFPRLWALHLACLGSSFLMGLSAWLVWAEGGFHRQPMAMLLYLGQLGLSLAWDPVVFKAGATRVGLVLCMALFGVLIACVKAFKNVNPIAGNLVKPCLGWAVLLSLANLKLVYP
ncbi:putative alkylated DNA repair protein alkB -like protein 8-like [Capsicum annuum]|uniref:translocator protein homolog n=1 Tax=Capsicum annuum TaxID=4072 RepID=UPI0007BFD6B0|nr:translocator protein homolog [Capsicum annuum]KAF3622331.1 putative alkylated DNA repair protein alkB -like protein 8-like [Capsicum annuum]KAF3626590.1 putative alkylated DNA repair protein alkB -like protein 8-like [Capsicum annuum]